MSIEECEALLKMMGKGEELIKWRRWSANDAQYLYHIQQLLKLHTGQYNGNHN